MPLTSAANRRRRIWCETLPLAEVGRPEVLTMLARYRLELLLSIRPGDVAALPDVVSACADARVSLGLWPQLDDSEGRWASDANAALVCGLVRRIVDRAPHATEVVLDLEPPIADVARMLEGVVEAQRVVRKRCMGALLRRDRFADAGRRYADLVAELRSRGFGVTAAIVPLVLLDARGTLTPWQRLLGTPLDTVEVSSVHAMMYTSLVEGYARGWLGRRAARRLLALTCRAQRTRFGARAGVSLGAVGTGALGDEPVYRGPDELAEDVAIARSAGIDDLALFELGGVLRRAPAEPWLDAFTGP